MEGFTGLSRYMNICMKALLWKMSRFKRSFHSWISFVNNQNDSCHLSWDGFLKMSKRKDWKSDSIKARFGQGSQAEWGVMTLWMCYQKIRQKNMFNKPLPSLLGLACQRWVWPGLMMRSRIYLWSSAAFIVHISCQMDHHEMENTFFFFSLFIFFSKSNNFLYSLSLSLPFHELHRNDSNWNWSWIEFRAINWLAYCSPYEHYIGYIILTVIKDYIQIFNRHTIHWSSILSWK